MTRRTIALAVTAVVAIAAVASAQFLDLRRLDYRPATVYQFLDTVGDGSGTKNMNGNYSLTADTFYIAPPAGQNYEIHRLLISVEDAGGMTAQEYGNTNSALTNGITIKIVDNDGDVDDLTDGVPIKTNAHWGRFCYDVDIKAWGAGDDLLVARWTFEKAGRPIRLNATNGEKLQVALSDNFGGLDAHYMLAQGFNMDVAQ